MLMAGIAQRQLPTDAPKLYEAIRIRAPVCGLSREELADLSCLPRTSPLETRACPLYRPMDPIETELRQAPLLSALSDAQMQRLLRRSVTLRLDDGQWLFSQDDPAERFYFVRTGRMRLFRLSADGGEKVIELVGPGQTFAEALMFMGTGHYPVCAAALGPAALVGIDAADFAAMLRESPDTCFALLASLSRRLRLMIGEIDGLTLQSATVRVARWLFAALPPGREALTLDVRKGVLASRLSIQPETWSRITRRLTDDGIIAVDGNRIQLLDRAALARIADESGDNAV